MDLKRLLHERIAEYDDLCKKSSDILQYYKKLIIIFGASPDGLAVLNYLKSVKGISPVAFCDNDESLRGSFYMGLPVYSIEDVCDKYDLKEITIINFSTEGFHEVEKQLVETSLPDDSYLNLYHIGCLDKDFLTCGRDILDAFVGYDVPASYFSPKYNGNFWAVKWPDVGYADMVYGDFLLANAAKIEQVYDYLADDESKAVYKKYIYAMGNKCLTPWERYCIRKAIVSRDTQYFPDDVIKIKENETFVNAGAYGGFEIVEFARRSNNRYSNIVSFEPDKCNFQQLKENSLLQGFKNNYILNEALYDKNCLLSFSSESTGSSSIDKGGDIYIKAVSLDDCLTRLAINDVSFIKMDIEGAEEKALLGAAGSIIKNKPKLAICIYHKPEDLFYLPLLIKRLLPEYKLHIRSHDFVYELVCYATI